MPADKQNSNYNPQNPDFNFLLTDAWGNYQAEGEERFSNMQPWVDQTPPSYFDPAAWQLKVIKLPSGGKIHVQYEQDDYAYVQDQPVYHGYHFKILVFALQNNLSYI